MQERTEKNPHTMLRARATTMNSRPNCMAVLPDIGIHWICSESKDRKNDCKFSFFRFQQYLRFRLIDGKI